MEGQTRFVSFVTAVSLCSPCFGQTKWTVEQDGSGDFSQIQPAISVAAPGDFILVGPGNYSAFTLDKPLSILGAGSDLTQVTQTIRVEGVDYFNLHDLSCWALHVEDVPERSTIQEVLVSDSTGYARAQFWNTGQLYALNLTVDSLFHVTNGADGLAVYEGSSVVLDSCVLRGGDQTQLFGDCYGGAHGGDGLVVFDSEVWVVHPAIFGGRSNGCPTTDPWGGGSLPGKPGRGICAVDNARVHLRGDGTQPYQSDVYGVGSGSWFENDVAAIATDSTSSVTYSGVPVFGQLTGSVLNDGPGQPYLSLKGRSGLGQEHRVELAADPSQLAVIFVSTDAALVEATELYGADIWLALNRATALTPITPTGFANPVTESWSSPKDPAFLGFQVTCQAGVIDLTSYAWTATNPVELFLTQ